MTRQPRLIDDGSDLPAQPACQHPPARVWFWFAYNCDTDKNDIPCAACCDCGQVLLGGVPDTEIMCEDCQEDTR